jgi:hypothetical protein
VTRIVRPGFRRRLVAPEVRVRGGVFDGETAGHGVS